MSQLLNKLRVPDRSLRKHLGSLRKRLSTRNDLRSGRNAILASGRLTNLEESMLSKVSLRLHPSDDMYTADAGRHYLGVGLSAMRNINKALAHARGGTPITTILDFPSGYARILRFLKIGFPDATIFGGDLKRDAVEFSRTAFGVRTTMSVEDINEISLPGPFDLIWSGSLLTHFDEKRALDVLKLFYRHLAPGGLCLFTMHGSTSIEWLSSCIENYGLSPSGRDKVLSEFASSGYGYADYHPGSHYGISVAKYSHILELASAAGDWTFSSFFERGWGKHHDVYGFTRGVAKPPSIILAQSPVPAKPQHGWPAEF
jgi:SAM-dependent methyltransferase